MYCMCYLLKWLKASFFSQFGHIWKNGFLNFLQKEKDFFNTGILLNLKFMRLVRFLTLPYSCRDSLYCLPFPDFWQNAVGPERLGPLWQPGKTKDRSHFQLWAALHQVCADLPLPADCLHAQTLGPQVHCVHTHSQFSLVQCTLLEPTWRCSFCDQ